ncbi:MAG TPA: hypothetical protein VKQ32_17840 [Polyangia bacterium]|nr:hypothetical protein [Polyangia bacterium]
MTLALLGLLAVAARAGTEGAAPGAGPGPPPAACTPIAGAVTLEEMPRPESLRLANAGLVQAIWTGTEVLIWASWQESRPLDIPRFAELDGFFAYSPRSKSWRVVPSRDVPHLRRPTFVWVGGRAILWGGIDQSTIVNEGAIFDPATGRVQATSPRNAPTPRQLHSAAAVGDRMMIFGGGGTGPINGWSCDGALFDPGRNSWSALAPVPAELCPWAADARIVAANADRAAVLFAEPSQSPRFRVAFYEISRSAWTEGVVFDPGRRIGFDDAGAFGPDGAVYLVGSDLFAQGATMFRIDPRTGRFEALAPACDSGPVFPSGAGLRVLGSAGLTCEVDLARKECVLPMRGIGFPHTRARQFVVATDQEVMVWGYGAGTIVRWGAAAQNVPPPPRGNVRAAVVSMTRGRCGGVPPPPWDPRIAETPARNLPLLIRRGNRNVDPKIAAEVRTDADGLFETTLSPGDYCLVGSGQREVKLKIPNSVDRPTAQCLANENAKCVATFRVPPSGAPPAPLIVRLANPCFGPCFHGSPPP